jgi:hypothetical protein
MDDDSKDRLGDAVDGMLERNREAMQQHGDLGGTANNDAMAQDQNDDPLDADPEDVERAIDELRRRAAEQALDEQRSSGRSPENVGE